MKLKQKTFARLAGILLLLLAGVAVHPATAQVLYGSVIGAVTDQSDAVVPGASVTLTNKDTGDAKVGTTDEGGRYSFVNVPSGRYDIKVVAKGFRPYTTTEVQVNPNTVAR